MAAGQPGRKGFEMGTDSEFPGNWGELRWALSVTQLLVNDLGNELECLLPGPGRPQATEVLCFPITLKESPQWAPAWSTAVLATRGAASWGGRPPGRRSTGSAWPAGLWSLQVSAGVCAG